jgi:hypothetical protein
MEIKYLQVLLMDNKEVICLGKSLCFADSKRGDKTFGDYLFTKKEVAKLKE